MSNCTCKKDKKLPDFHDTNSAMAKKTYKCCECGFDIEKGESYTCDRGVWEGESAIYRTCSDCKSLRDAFCHEDGWFFGGVLNQVLSFIDKNNLDTIKERMNGLTALAVMFIENAIIQIKGCE